MLRNITRFIIVILVIFGAFFGITIHNNDISDKNMAPGTVNFNVNSNLQNVESLNLGLGNTIISKDDATNSGLFSDCYYALLVDDSNNEIYASKNIYKRMYPASMTKLMTASLVCDKIEEGAITLDDIVTINTKYDLTSEDGGINDFSIGSTITVKDLLYGLLVHSNNYYALYLADYVAGDVSTFIDLMNQKAASIGATNTHFNNPHGLDDPNHYSTAYDMYLIAKEAHSHAIIEDISSYESYSYTYNTAQGTPIQNDVIATNLFVTGDVSLPSGFTIETWKTGTTDAAGYCLTMYLKKNNHDYVAVISDFESRASLYDSMVRMLCLIK